jgi:HEPN domain-containing protein
MEADRLALTYFKKSRARRKALQVLFDEESYADVVREAQEICELVLKAVLRLIGIEPPKFHDVGKILVENSGLLPEAMRAEVDEISRHSFELRRDRELAFCGALDVDPWEDYRREDAVRTIEWVDGMMTWVRAIDPES